ncbi:MAG: hypothetical protein AAB890_02150, partial [Patescibacteria group bacterium]
MGVPPVGGDGGGTNQCMPGGMGGLGGRGGEISGCNGGLPAGGGSAVSIADAPSVPIILTFCCNVGLIFFTSSSSLEFPIHPPDKSVLIIFTKDSNLAFSRTS